jgi:hypothetical protein
MSTPLAPLAIRLLCDLAARGTPPVDINTGQPPLFYRGDDVEIDIGIGMDGVLLAPSLANITSVTCQVFDEANDDTNAPLMSCTVLAASMNLALTATQWTNDTTPFYHAAFIFPNSQTAISLGGAASVNYWLRVFLTTADATPKQITLCEGPITVVDGPISAASPPAPGNVRFYTVGGVTVLQIRNDSNGLYYTVGIENVEGAPTLYLGNTGY